MGQTTRVQFLAGSVMGLLLHHRDQTEIGAQKYWSGGMTGEE